MKCLFCKKECIDEKMNVCSNCSTSGLEYKENNIDPIYEASKTKRFWFWYYYYKTKTRIYAWWYNWWQYRVKGISLSHYEMEHLYSMAIDNFEEDCCLCQCLKKKIEKFLGKETMKEIMKSKRNKK
jgi:hypothetical protein